MTEKKKKKSRRLPPTEWQLRGTMVRNARHSAKKYGVPFNLTASDITIPEVCPVTGIPLMPTLGKRGGGPQSPSLVRIMPELGYVAGNVQVVSALSKIIQQNKEALAVFGVTAGEPAEELEGN